MSETGLWLCQTIKSPRKYYNRFKPHKMPEKGPEDVHFGALSIYRINVCLQSVSNSMGT